MRDAIQERGCHLGIAEDRDPFPELQIGRDDDTGLLVKRTKGCLSRDGLLHIPLIVLLCKTTAGRWMFKRGQCAEKSWRKLRGFAHLADVIQGVDFIIGIKPSNQNQAAA